MIKVGNILIEPNDISSIHLESKHSSEGRDVYEELIQIIYKNGVVKNIGTTKIGMSYSDFIKALLERQEKDEDNKIFRLMAAIKSMNNG